MSKNNDNTGLLLGGIALLAIVALSSNKKGSPAPSNNTIHVPGKPIDNPVVNQKVNEKLNATFSKTTIDNLKKLNPAAQAIFANFIADIIRMGYAVVVTSSYRPTSEQVALKKKNANNATPGFSMHEYGLGLDINLVNNGKWINKSSTDAEWEKTGVVALAKNKYKMRWGGDFANYQDPVHFDLGNKYNVNTLYAAAKKKWGDPVKFKGNELPLAA